MIITAATHDELNLLRHLISSLAECPTHLQEISPDEPTWIGATDASLKRMGVVYRSPTGKWHIFRLTVDIYTKCRLLTDKNPGGNLRIIYPELAV